MNCYEPSIPRAKLGFAAFAMTAITVSVMVVLPATLESSSTGERSLAAAGSGTDAPARIERHLAQADVPAAKLEKERPLGSHGRLNRPQSRFRPETPPGSTFVLGVTAMAR